MIENYRDDMFSDLKHWANTRGFEMDMDDFSAMKDSYNDMFYDYVRGLVLANRECCDVQADSDY
jgi:hypothetical protein